MLQVDNRSPFAASFSMFPDEDGVDTIYPVIKGTFDLTDGVALATEQLELATADEYRDDPNKSSLICASEMMALKPATDVIMLGHAYAPAERPAQELEVSLRIGPRTKTVQVYGNRVWKKGLMGSTISQPEPFLKIPLIYERAFGGSDTTRKGDPVSYWPNPVGIGYHHPKGINPNDDWSLPNFEDPRQIMRRPQHTPLPAVFAPVCPHWEPRVKYAGTYDEKWLSGRAPYLPPDFDMRFHNVAPPDLVFDPYLTGGEEVEIINATSNGRFSFRFPNMEFNVVAVIDGSQQQVRVNLDTVCIEPDENRLTMLWRGKCSCDKKLLKMEVLNFEIRHSDPAVKGMPCQTT